MIVTVVVPTYNRSLDLDRCLRALRAQTLDPNCFEAIVVDDGSMDATPLTLERWSREWSALRCYRQTNGGPAAARNRGILEARGSIIAFTDDDCVPPPDWALHIHNRFEAGLRGCIQGAVTSSAPNSTFVHSVITHGDVTAANLSMERRVFDVIGLFDTSFFPPAWCEDTDMYCRMKKESISITYDPELVVDHPPRYQRFMSFLRKSKSFQYYGLLARKHPDMEPLSTHRDRLILALKKVAVLLLAVLASTKLLDIPAAAGPAAALIVFWIVDGWRLNKMKSSLAHYGIHVRWQDQILYVLLNWSSNIFEGYYIMKGAIVYSQWLQ